jgi:D-3-phosphoglycerate dehydrogenase
MADKFRVGLTRDILDSRGQPAFGAAALGILDAAAHIEWEYLPALTREITADHAARYDALYVNTPQVPAAAVSRDNRRLRVVARHGVGFDSVDVPAMTKAGVIVTHTPSSMPRPVATIALTFILALAGKLMLKDRLTRTGRWHERMDNMGSGLTDRTLGVVGAGRIGKELLRMARVFDVALLAADPNVDAIELGYVGARKVDLDTLVAESDYVVVCCSLDATTRYLLGAPQFARMKPNAYFVNVARGPIVDERRRDRRVAPQDDRGCGARRLRAGARRSGQSAADNGQRDRHAACAVLDRRMLSQHGDDGPRQHRRCAGGPAAALRRQSGRPRASARPRPYCPVARRPSARRGIRPCGKATARRTASEIR